MDIEIRDAVLEDYSLIVAINDAQVSHTSPMGAERLTVLDHHSCYHRVAMVNGCVAAFLIAMRENCGYKNDNYEWFALRYKKFLYVDRIVVKADCAGFGIGSHLYRDLFNYARLEAIPRVTCEYNVTPPNEPSRLFHNNFGFREVGEQWFNDGAKKVSLQAAASRSDQEKR